MHTSFFKYTVIYALLLCGIQTKAELHEFKLNDGRTIKAEVMKYNSTLGTVDIKRKDGKIVRVKSDIFSEKDQKYVEEWRKPPEGVVRIPEGTNSGVDPDFGEYSLTVTGFYMDQYEVTKDQWNKVYKWAISHGYEFDNEGSGKGAKHPVQTVSWYDCVKWCNARSQMEKRTPCYTIGDRIYTKGQSAPDCDFDANGFRLPTLVEWNYSARGGLKDKRFPWGDVISHKLANYNARNSVDYDDSDGCHPSFEKEGKEEMPYTSPVGTFPPNNYGLYDMAGNVDEWCWDSSDFKRSLRGCSWGSSAKYARCGHAADYFEPTKTYHGFGFRTICQ